MSSQFGMKFILFAFRFLATSKDKELFFAFSAAACQMSELNSPNKPS